MIDDDDYIFEEEIESEDDHQRRKSLNNSDALLFPDALVSPHHCSNPSFEWTTCEIFKTSSKKMKKEII